MDLVKFVKSNVVKVDEKATYEMKVFTKPRKIKGKGEVLMCRETSGKFVAPLYLYDNNAPSAERAKAIGSHGYKSTEELLGKTLPVRCANLKTGPAVSYVLFKKRK